MVKILIFPLTYVFISQIDEVTEMIHSYFPEQILITFFEALGKGEKIFEIHLLYIGQ